MKIQNLINPLWYARAGAYRIRWIRNSVLCMYRNRYPVVDSRSTSQLIGQHAKQRMDFSAIVTGRTEAEERRHFRRAADFKQSLLGAERFRYCLEIGCESGWFVRELVQKGIAAHGIGIDLQKAGLHPNTGVHLAQASADSLPLARVGFDLFVALHVVEHLERLDRFAAELHRVAAPGAQVLLALPLGYDTDPCHRWHKMTGFGWKQLMNKECGLNFLRGGTLTTNITEFIGLFALDRT